MSSKYFDYVLYKDYDPESHKNVQVYDSGDAEEMYNYWAANTTSSFDNSYTLLVRDPFTGAIESEYQCLGEFNPSIEKSDPVNPEHYQGFVLDLQWIEAQQYTIPDFESAINMQVKKYQDRLGKKDDEVQELKKSLWYLGFWIAYKINGNKPIRVKDIPRLLDIDNIWKG